MNRIGRPRNARSRRTRAALLDSALAIVRAEGPEAVTMERVASEAGVSRRAVYLHVSSRAELFVELLGHVDAQLDLEASIRPLREATTPGRKLDAWARHVSSYHHELLPLVRTIDAERRRDPDVGALHHAAMQAWMAECRVLAETVAQAGQLAAPWDVDTATDLLWALMGVELLEDLIEDRRWSEADYADRLALLVRRTLLVDPTAQ